MRKLRHRVAKSVAKDWLCSQLFRTEQTCTRVCESNTRALGCPFSSKVTFSDAFWPTQFSNRKELTRSVPQGIIVVDVIFCHDSLLVFFSSLTSVRRQMPHHKGREASGGESFVPQATAAWTMFIRLILNCSPTPRERREVLKLLLSKNSAQRRHPAPEALWPAPWGIINYDLSL